VVHDAATAIFMAPGGMAVGALVNRRHRIKGALTGLACITVSQVSKTSLVRLLYGQRKADGTRTAKVPWKEDTIDIASACASVATALILNPPRRFSHVMKSIIIGVAAPPAGVLFGTTREVIQSAVATDTGSMMLSAARQLVHSGGGSTGDVE